jgi:Holliday junction resolvase RusA-like endonuclease
MPRERHTKKPDEDNLKKAVYDALNKMLWRDDSQICESAFEKWIAAGDEQPHVVIRVTEVSPA